MDFFEDVLDAFEGKKHDKYKGSQYGEYHNQGDFHKQYTHFNYENNQGNVEVKLCHRCSTKIEPRYKFCPECGVSLKGPPQCYNCGFKLPGEAHFCSNCGTKVK